MADINIFENGWNSINSYIFGWVMSDGCLMKEGRNKTSYSIRIASNDRKIIEWLHFRLCIGNKIYKQGERGFIIKYRNKESIDFMRELGLRERKSCNATFPNVPSEYLGDFIRGYFDGNGSIILNHTKYNTYAQVSFASGSSAFLYSLKDKLANLGIDSHLYKDGRENKNCSYLRITKRSELEKLFNLMYEKSDSFSRLERKYKKYDLYLECKPKYRISKTA